MGADLFVDAGRCIALADTDDQFHAAAAAYPTFLQRYRRLLTTTLVVAEAYVALRLAIGHSAAIRFLDLLDACPRIQRVPVGPAIEQAAEALLRQYPDQRFSYADGVSFATMWALDVTDAFAFDRHFTTAGFVRVPDV